MSIATAIQNAQQKVANAYTAVDNKGGTLPATQDLSNLPTAISSIPTGSSPVIDSLSVTPTTSQQTITAPSGTDGYSPITVAAVTSSIDNNITAGNIKKDVTILGVTGTYEGGGGGTDNLPAFISDGVSSFTDNTITSIRQYACYNMNSTQIANPITSVSCQNVTTINSYAFQGCSQLQTASFPSVTTLGNGSFNSCTSLTSAPLPEGLTSIGGSCFNGCTGITTITIPSTVTTIGNSAFNNMTNLEEVNFNATNCSFATSSNSNGVFQKIGANKNNLVFNIGKNVTKIYDYFLEPSSTPSNLPNIQTLNIPSDNNISTLGKNCFWRCTGLTSLALPKLTTIQTDTTGACQYCTNLVSLDMKNLTTISVSQALSYLCDNCTSLTTVDLSSLSSMAVSYALRSAFSYCTSLQSLSFPSLNSSSFGSYTNQFYNMLQGVTGCTVHFPSNLQSVIGSWSHVTNGFGGTNTTVLFDLTATN